MIRRRISLLSLMAIGLTAAREMVRGAGEDNEKAGEAVTRTAEKAAN